MTGLEGVREKARESPPPMLVESDIWAQTVKPEKKNKDTSGKGNGAARQKVGVWRPSVAA